MSTTGKEIEATAGEWKIVGNPKASASSLMPLAKHADWEIRQELAYHPRCPKRALDILINDEDWVMRSAALRHPAT